MLTHQNSGKKQLVKLGNSEGEQVTDDIGKN